MKRIYPISTPEAQGIPSSALLRFQKALDEHRVPLHSVLLMRKGHVVCEAYSAPFTEDTLHRMYSVTKSFVSLAIGLLQEEGCLNLKDCVADYFADKLKGRELHPYIRETTIRHLLCMASPHTTSAYKVLYSEAWESCDMVESFFICPPTHKPGTCFAYDTSATHVLCALVERMTGKKLMAYLHEKCLHKLNFSPEAYCLEDANGHSLGGSGLMAAPYDLLRIMHTVMNGGRHEGCKLFPEAYLREATAKQIDNYAKPPSGGLDESMGYGYLFWRTRKNGFACYGMGGQLAVCFPDQELIFVTTADVQDIPGGVQLIYDTFFREVWPYLNEGPLPENLPDYHALQAYSASRKLPCVPGKTQSLLMNRINGACYVLDDNPMGFRSIKLTWQKDQGTLTYENQNGLFALPFAMGDNLITRFPEGDYRCAVSGAFRDEGVFVICAQLIDVCVGSITFELAFQDEHVTLLMHKVEETLFGEYRGIVSGRMALETDSF